MADNDGISSVEPPDDKDGDDEKFVEVDPSGRYGRVSSCCLQALCFHLKIWVYLKEKNNPYVTYRSFTCLLPYPSYFPHVCDYSPIEHKASGG